MASNTKQTRLVRKLKRSSKGQSRKRDVRVLGSTPKLLPLEGSLEAYFSEVEASKKAKRVQAKAKNSKVKKV